MPRKLSILPVPKFHAPSGLMRVRWKYRDYWLGKSGTVETREAYQQLLRWVESGYEIPRDWKGRAPGESVPANQPAAHVEPYQLTISHLVARYLEHCHTYYRGSNEGEHMELATRQLVASYGQTSAADFGPLRLKAVREQLIEAGRTRQGVNKVVNRMRRLFAWAVENELLAVEVYQRLKLVRGLSQGRTEAPESKPVKPVDEPTVFAIRDHVTPQVWAMVHLQWLTGMRPGEVQAMRPADIDRTGPLWVYRPAKHKTQHRGHTRDVILGPQAQAILTTWLEGRKPELYLFSPREAIEWYRQTASKARTTPLSCGNQRGSKQVKGRQRQKEPGLRYDNHSYRRAVEVGCKAAGVTVFTPHQLRHTAATRIRAEFGLEAAQAVCGHRTIAATQIYAEKNLQLAAQVAERLG